MSKIKTSYKWKFTYLQHSLVSQLVHRMRNFAAKFIAFGLLPTRTFNILRSVVVGKLPLYIGHVVRSNLWLALIIVQKSYLKKFMQFVNALSDGNNCINQMI